MSRLRIAWLGFFVMAAVLAAMAAMASPPLSAGSLAFGVLVGCAAGVCIAPTRADFPDEDVRSSRGKRLLYLGVCVAIMIGMPQLMRRIPRSVFQWVNQLPSLSKEDAGLLMAAAFPGGVAAFVTAGALAAWRDLRTS